jgi:hypothetical protein
MGAPFFVFPTDAKPPRVATRAGSEGDVLIVFSMFLERQRGRRLPVAGLRPFPAPGNANILPTMTSTSPDPSPWSLVMMARFSLRSLCSVALVAALSVACGTGCGKPSSKAPNPLETAALSRVRAAGFPVTLEELNAWYPEVPAAENAAVL